ncbi:large ribosomal subunit protein uL22m-like [Diadema antillarum]|uniref:large ribosomal subunit protein uL22m-like n=1 Tax=Diadema antillarum TaxID=105358 RepID=UPI003A87E2B3
MSSLNFLRIRRLSLLGKMMSANKAYLATYGKPSVVPYVFNPCWIISNSVTASTTESMRGLGLDLTGADLCNSQRLSFHTSANTSAWESKNKTVYPPQKPGEPRRPAEVHYARRDIKYSQRKMWYITTFIKGMMIDDALNQLEHVNKKGAKIAREVLLEAQEAAVKNHNVEFKSNLHIADAFVGKGKYEHAIRYHAKGRASILDLVYCHLFIKLKEGPPPEQPTFTGYDQARHFLVSKRSRTIIHGL